jgi:hypothetical protein
VRNLWTLFDVCCPFCGAGFDQRCQTSSGRSLPTFHVARRTAYSTAKAALPVRPVG